ncbi:MAG TPA: TIGR02677 family protein [Solirubrobacteraceae bacterium]|nr:TIGR02677 family protein [Solirubrobacteraceae bacterium]
MSSPELSPALRQAALELAGAREADPPAPQPTAPAATTADRLGAHPVLRYATAEEEAPAYRRIMRVLYLEHQAFGLRLRPAQVADRLRERYALTVDVDWLEERLKTLGHWGAVERDHDAGLASTAAEWRRNRYTYDVTPAGRLTEELLARLDALGEEIGRLDTARLPAIRDALAKLADELAAAEPDGGQLRALFERVLAEVEALHGGALAFMRSLGDLMRTVDRVGEDEFERGKGALLEHLQGFKKSRMQHSADILALIERIDAQGPDELVGRIVAAEEFVALPGGVSVEDQRARRRAELLDRWQGLRAWFVGDDDTGSPWRTLNDQVVDAIRAVLTIAERLIERRSLRVDRAGVLVHLAAQVTAAPPGEATAWIRAAFGVRTARHVGVAEADPEQVAERGRTPWLDAPPAPVVAHLRTPGTRAPGSGRGAQIADLTEGRRRLQERRAAERRELDELLRRMSARGSIRLSALERVDAHEFRHLLAWIGRAYESPAAADGTRRAESSDGRASIALRQPDDPRAHRARLRAPHGTLDLPDFEIEVLGR